MSDRLAWRRKSWENFIQWECNSFEKIITLLRKAQKAEREILGECIQPTTVQILFNGNATDAAFTSLDSISQSRKFKTYEEVTARDKVVMNNRMTG